MIRSLVALISLLSLPSHAGNWIVQMHPDHPALSATADCDTKLLNPNLGGDVWSVSCGEFLPSTLSFSAVLKAEQSTTWNLFLDSDAPSLHSDPMSSDQWSLDRMRVREFWDSTSIGDVRTIVAVVDSGYDYGHEDLTQNLAVNPGEIPGNGVDDDENGYVDDVRGWNAFSQDGEVMDTLEHGTHVSGTIGASVNNNIGVAGLNWKVSLVPVKAFGPRGEATTEGIVRAIDYAVARGARIVNASWGGRTESPLLLEILTRCRDKGILLVAAAGNEGVNNDFTPTYPASFPLDNILSVASIDLHDDLSWFSNFGATTVHVAAPGESILSTIPGQKYGYKNGTSMATPHITGAAALIWSAHPTWTHQEVRDYILQHCTPLPSLQGKVVCQGYFSF